MTNETAPERCEYCNRSIWADEEIELFVDADQEAECPEAPMVISPAGAEYPMVSGIHEVG